MKTFMQFLRIREANESDHLRKVMIANMGLEGTIDEKTGEDIPLEQLDIQDIGRKLIGSGGNKGSAIWEKLSPKVQKNAQNMLRNPMNKRLADLLNVLTSEPLNLGQIAGDEESAPQTTPDKTTPPTPGL